jgi:hypothetical protein
MDADATMDAVDDLPCGSLAHSAHSGLDRLAPAHSAHSLGDGDIGSSMNKTQTLETPR